MENMKKACISIVVPTYNEAENVDALAAAVKAELAASLARYDYEILFIDNRSTDGTRERIAALCAADPRIKAIFNIRNFGQFRSPYHGLCCAEGDCAILLAADFQDPISLLPRLVAEWERGHRIVCAIKKASMEHPLLRALRTCYYRLIRRLSEVEQIEHFTGFGLYDRSFLDVLRSLDEAAPFLRGLVAELGFDRTEIPYVQARRRAGKTHNSLKTLYDAAMLSFTTYTKAPLRFFTPFGLLLFFASALYGLLLLILRPFGIRVGILALLSPMGMLTALPLVAVGILGEYLLTLRTRILHRPVVGSTPASVSVTVK